MSRPLYLFCGGRPYDGQSRPKPLTKIDGDQSLLEYFLRHLKSRSGLLPTTVTLLCDDGQERSYQAEVDRLSYSIPIYVQPCGHRSSTFEKYRQALSNPADLSALIQFGYPDIFTFGEVSQLREESLDLDSFVYVSAAALTSRFPRLIVDVYNNKIQGISNYSSLVPANPLHVFGGDLWGRLSQLRSLTDDFLSQHGAPGVTLEYDFFFWLINHNKMRCVMMHDQRLWIDSARDIERLVSGSGEF
jgi:hypothetical protein